mmetsp:Transcript_36315/g.34318  ORF Transcript_36315/g.34318 Transcript_36315/m.34318 type:complete len:139 (-) Transcript_36315:1494-1910(-)
MICCVGYALNPKKLRKSGREPDEKSLSRDNAAGSINHNNDSLSVAHSSSSSSGSINSNADNSNSSICNSRNNNDSEQTWRGGGLADIVSDGLECEGVQFIPWNYEIPVALQPEFHVIIHKLTEDIDRKESEDKIAGEL